MRRYPTAPRALATLAILLLAYIVSFLDRQILALMVNPIRADLNISDFQVSLLQGLAFALFFSMMGIPIGRLADRYNRIYIIATGILFWSLMTALCGLANSFLALFVFRMGVGIGEAALAPAGYSVLGDSFPPDKLVRATSLFGQGTTLGAGLSLLVGGQVIEYFERLKAAPFGVELAPWQLTFLAVGLPGIVVAGLVLLIREPERQGRSSMSDINFTAALASFWRMRATLAPLYICGTLLSIVNFGAVTWFPTHLTRNFGLTPGEIGLKLGLIHLGGGLLGATLGALFTERLIRSGAHEPYLRTVFIVASLIACFMITPLLGNLGLVTILWFFAVTVQGAYSGSVMAAIQVTVPNELRGLSTALLLVMSSLGGLALGSALIGGASQLFFPDDPAGVGKAFTLVGVTCAASSAFIAWYRLRSRATRQT
jgi:MFS family permease